ncbi:mucin-2-like [Sycon ciliatum]|uniref:mucin-2-like n=1 Tax=Sycon ciliatum TaxID=27933 RepID=UPI0031F6051A
MQAQVSPPLSQTVFCVVMLITTLLLADTDANTSGAVTSMVLPDGGGGDGGGPPDSGGFSDIDLIVSSKNVTVASNGDVTIGCRANSLDAPPIRWTTLQACQPQFIASKADIHTFSSAEIQTSFSVLHLRSMTQSCTLSCSFLSLLNTTRGTTPGTAENITVTVGTPPPTQAPDGQGSEDLTRIGSHLRNVTNGSSFTLACLAPDRPVAWNVTGSCVTWFSAAVANGSIHLHSLYLSDRSATLYVLGVPVARFAHACEYLCTNGPATERFGVNIVDPPIAPTTPAPTTPTQMPDPTQAETTEASSGNFPSTVPSDTAQATASSGPGTGVSTTGSSTSDSVTADTVPTSLLGTTAARATVMPSSATAAPSTSHAVTLIPATTATRSIGTLTSSQTSLNASETITGNVVLRCTCMPACTYKWLDAESTQLVPSSFGGRLDVQSYAGRGVLSSTLSLEDPERHDDGIYQCQATFTDASVKSISFTLGVYYAPEVYTSPSSTYSARVGDDLVVSSAAVGNPAPVATWAIYSNRTGKLVEEPYMDTFGALAFETSGHNTTATLRLITAVPFAEHLVVFRFTNALRSNVSSATVIVSVTGVTPTSSTTTSPASSSSGLDPTYFGIIASGVAVVIAAIIALVCSSHRHRQHDLAGAITKKHQKRHSSDNDIIANRGNSGSLAMPSERADRKTSTVALLNRTSVDEAGGQQSHGLRTVLSTKFMRSPRERCSNTAPPPPARGSLPEIQTADPPSEGIYALMAGNSPQLPQRPNWPSKVNQSEYISMDVKDRSEWTNSDHSTPPQGQSSSKISVAHNNTAGRAGDDNFQYNTSQLSLDSPTRQLKYVKSSRKRSPSPRARHSLGEHSLSPLRRDRGDTMCSEASEYDVNYGEIPANFGRLAPMANDTDSVYSSEYMSHRPVSIITQKSADGNGDDDSVYSSEYATQRQMSVTARRPTEVSNYDIYSTGYGSPGSAE